MNTRRSRLFLVCGFVVLTAQLGLAVPVQWSGNGHWYEVIVIPEPGVSWSEAEAAAEAKGGYLATITSAAENQFVYNLTVSTPGAWAYSAEWAIGPCLGGYQDLGAPDYSEPSGGWRWVTGEPWGYTNWLVGQPDDWLNFEHRLIFWSYYSPAPTWNDFNGDAGIINYVIEYDSLPPRIGLPKGKSRLLAVLSNPSTASDCIQLEVQFFSENPAPPHGQYDWSIVSGDDKVKFLGFPLDQKGPRVTIQPIGASTSRDDVNIKVKFTSWTAGVPSCEAYYQMTVLKPTSSRIAEGFPIGPDIHYNSGGGVVGYIVDYGFQVYDQFDEPIPVERMQVNEQMDVLCWSHRIIFVPRFETYWTDESGVWEELLGTPYHDLYKPIPETFIMKVDQNIYVEGWLVGTRCQTYHYDYVTSEEGSCTGGC